MTNSTSLARSSKQIKFTNLTAAEVRHKLNSDEWKEEWEHPQILNELLMEPLPPTTAEVLPYEFDHEDQMTHNLLRTINGVLVGEHMREHVLSVKKPEASRMHPRFGPFTLLALDSENVKYGVLNKKNDRAFTFKHSDFKLDTDGTDFDLEDETTYSIICTLGPQFLWKKIVEAKNQNVETLHEINGPFQVLPDKRGSNTISFRNKSGQLWSFTLGPDHPEHSTWRFPSNTHRANTAPTP